MDFLEKLILPEELNLLLNEKELIVPESRAELMDLAMGRSTKDIFEVEYEIPGSKKKTLEATVVRCKNGFAVNYPDIYMRRRDPNSLVVADNKDTDKVRYKDRFGKDFSELRQKTFEWFASQKRLIVMPFMAGNHNIGFPSLLIAPSNAGFFAGGLADLQGFIPKNDIPNNFKPRSIIYLAPPFRHTHFDGSQVVVHNRIPGLHELFSFNLYPGPSAKKGVYGVLLNIGEEEGWVTLHGSSVKLITPYDNEFVIMHEGASGSGKSEMLEEIHRMKDGRILLAKNIISSEKIIIEMPDTCTLLPVTDDMALTHPSIQQDKKKLVITDAEDGWFIRLDHIKQYGSSPEIEKLCIHPPEPLIFLNLEGKANSTCLIWEHTMDEANVPCPNPRVIIPRRFNPNIITESVEVDIRSFGVRCPPTTKSSPNYGIIGFMHILPPALAWLWRLVAPRGHSNPSIVGGEGMESEGVGSFWPFSTGKRVSHANLLLEQIIRTSSTRYILIPNQFVGAYKTGFMAEWITREYFSRRGSSRFKPDQIEATRCPLLGFFPKNVRISGTYLPNYLLQVENQPEVGIEAYDEGARMLAEFFKKELQSYLTPDLSVLGKRIIEVCLKDGKLKDYFEVLPYSY
jgi:hypothetical protein